MFEWQSVQNLCSRLAHVFLFVFGLILVFTPQPLFAEQLIANDFPNYKIDVSYHHDKTLLVGKMQVRFTRKAYPAHELLFALPGNRFRFPDVRGTRKHKIVPVFSLRRFQDNLEDPKSPTGFSPGNLEITSVNIFTPKSSTGKHKLAYSLEANPDLEVGYSTAKGLLRIFLPKDVQDTPGFPGESTIQLEFSTKFPEHAQEGTVNGMLMTTNWHPKLLNWSESIGTKNTGWETAGNNPSPATFEVTWKAAQAGTLITTPGHYKLLAGQTVSLPVSKRPLKYFPLIFSNVHQQLADVNRLQISWKKSKQGTPEETYQLTSFYLKGHERRAELLHNWSASFLTFLRIRYGLTSTWESILIVAVEAEYEQVDVINNLVLIPLPNYKRSELMDRQVLGFLTRRLAQLWFGETIWSDQDTQQWLNLGLPAFLGLRFIEHKFGPDAGIFDAFDWMNPRYRDHYYESMVNSISPKMRYPILSSFRKNPDSQKYLQTLTYKTAMVFSMLEYLLGKRAFQQGLQHFSQTYHQNLVGIKEFQQAMEKFNFPALRIPPLPDEGPYRAEGPKSLEWFFSQWFRTVKTLDYSFEDSATKTLSNGKYETEIKINKIGTAKMPIVVALRTKDGLEIRKMLPGIERQETVRFLTESYPEKVSLDPEEKLIETSRMNNHSFNFYRVRFGLDWKKQREHLVLLVPGFGNNALDGNSFGIGIRYKFDNYRVYAIPGYGTKNKRGLYIFNLDRDNLGLHGLTAGFSVREFGGVRSQGIRVTYKPPQNPDEVEYKFHSSFSRETLFSAGNSSQNNGVTETGKSNTFLLEQTGSFRPRDFYEINWDIWNEQPALALESDFSYVRGQATLGQILRVGYRKWFELDFIHATTSGETPLQKKFQLGGPNVLRGYPQQTVLSDEHLFASRLDYKFPLITAPLWGIVSAFKIQGAVFYDQGRIWSENISFEKAKNRKNVGMGIEWTVDTASLFQVPIKFEVAFPLDDQDYKKPQFIFLGVLTGS